MTESTKRSRAAKVGSERHRDETIVAAIDVTKPYEGSPDRPKMFRLFLLGEGYEIRHKTHHSEKENT